MLRDFKTHGNAAFVTSFHNILLRFVHYMSESCFLIIILIHLNWLSDLGSGACYHLFQIIFFIKTKNKKKRLKRWHQFQSHVKERWCVNYQLFLFSNNNIFKYLYWGTWWVVCIKDQVNEAQERNKIIKKILTNANKKVKQNIVPDIDWTCICRSNCFNW